MLTQKHEMRSIYSGVMKQGGVNQFDGPARDAYMDVASKTGGDIVQAHAAAKRVQESHTQMLKDRAEGFITDDDLKREDAYNKDGSFNYQNLRLIAAANSGRTAGKAVKGESATVRQDLQVLSDLKDASDEDSVALRAAAAKRLRAHYEGTGTAPPAAAAAATPSAAPSATPEATPSKPRTVTQNGHVYTLQPDGSYR
jgi:hypothetical protein